VAGAEVETKGRDELQIEIRLVRDPASCRLVEDLQLAVWGMDEREVLPYHQLIAATAWGGLLLVAWHGGEPIGFSYGFLGAEEGEAVLCSHMLAVLPDYRSHDVGYRLKIRQAEFARERGLQRVVWTFDPLESRNAHLNLHKLGAVVERYSVEHYGPMDDELNRGIPSDRLIVDWWIGAGGSRTRSSKEGGRFGEEDPPVLNPPSVAERVPRPGTLSLEPLEEVGRALIALPSDTGAVRGAPEELALPWRLNVRAAFQAAFGAGFRAVDLVHRGGDLSHYVLERRRAR
jgi:predicted GNAT superfamily acetyltransferase